MLTARQEKSKFCIDLLYLRGNVVWSATKGGGGNTIQDSLFTHAKVRQLAVTFSIQQNVIELQVSDISIAGTRQKRERDGFKVSLKSLIEQSFLMNYNKSQLTVEITRA